MEQGTQQHNVPEIETKIRAFFEERFSDVLIRANKFRGDWYFHIRPDAIIDVCEALVDDDTLGIAQLSDLTSCDWLNTEYASDGRFEVVYNFLSITHRYRFFVCCHLPEDNPTIESIVQVFAGANWMEREVWDLMGITFEGHPDLTKILTPDDLEGHPLRKDFPLTWEQPVFSWNKDDPPEVIK